MHLEANQVNMTELVCGVVCPRRGVVLCIDNLRSLDDVTNQMIKKWLHDGEFVH